jgi:hypothetical protein
MIYDLDYVLGEQHGDYVLEIKQDCTPLDPSKLDQINILLSKEIIPVTSSQPPL